MEPDEEQSVGHRQLRLRGNAPAQDVQLMPQYDDLSLECARALNGETRTWRNRIRNAIIAHQPTRSHPSRQRGWSIRYRQALLHFNVTQPRVVDRA
jgi:hypothetical protein